MRIWLQVGLREAVLSGFSEGRLALLVTVFNGATVDVRLNGLDVARL